MSLATPDWGIVALFLAAGIATYLTRVGGLVIVARLKLGRRAVAALEAVPAAVLTAVIAPTVLAHGLAEFLAGLLTIAAATRLPLLAVVAVGVATVIVLRALLT